MASVGLPSFLTSIGNITSDTVHIEPKQENLHYPYHLTAGTSLSDLSCKICCQPFRLDREDRRPETICSQGHIFCKRCCLKSIKCPTCFKATLLQTSTDGGNIADAEINLIQAAQNSNVVDVKRLLESGINPDCRHGHHLSAVNTSGQLLLVNNEGNWTPLHWAVEHGSVEVCQLLLQHGATIDALDYLSKTPLCWAAEYGREEVCRFLLLQGASVEATDRTGQTPLHKAATYGHEKVCQVLIHFGAKINSLDAGMWCPLHWAAEYGHVTVCQFLLEKGAAVDALDKCHRTPLFWAAMNGHEKVCEILLSHGAKIGAVSLDQMTPLQEATKRGHNHLLKILSHQSD